MDDPIIVTEYDPAWPKLYEREAARLHQTLGKRFILCMEHVGSTAVPGLASKPIIDILIGVASLNEAKQYAVPILEALGYGYWRDNPDPSRLFFVRGLPPHGPRTYHIHIVEMSMSGRDWNKIAFRDYLRAHPDEAARYAALKQTLAARFCNDREAYTDGKSEYIQRVLSLAEENPPRRDLSVTL